MTPRHIPVLPKETLEAFIYLAKKKEVIFVDGTLGLAGHSLAIASLCLGKSSKCEVIGIDKDQKALKVAKENILKAGLSDCFTLVHDDFNNIVEILNNLKIEKVDGFLLDLGVSSMQLDDKSRGFSFSDPTQPLDMRMNQGQRFNAEAIVNQYSEKELEEILIAGEERHYRKVARAIVSSRKAKPFRTVGDLLDALAPVLKRGYSRTHYATDTFRALRMEVNDEIGRLESTVEKMAAYLNPGARLAVITFHSIEDRIIKDTFKKLANPCTCPPKLPVCVCGLKPTVKLVTRKPVIAASEETANNPRARSAKLRVIEKL